MPALNLRPGFAALTYKGKRPVSGSAVQEMRSIIPENSLSRKLGVVKTTDCPSYDHR